MTDQEILEAYNCGLEKLASFTSDDVTKALYGIRKTDDGLTYYLWFWALSKWDNRQGAVNSITTKQLRAIISRLNV